MKQLSCASGDHTAMVAVAHPLQTVRESPESSVLPVPALHVHRDASNFVLLCGTQDFS
jgi:hypothetical protein